MGVGGRLDLAAQHVAVRPEEKMPWRIVFLEPGHGQDLRLDVGADFRQPGATGRGRRGETGKRHGENAVAPDADRLDDQAGAGALGGINREFELQETSFTNSTTWFSSILTRTATGSPGLTMIWT